MAQAYLAAAEMGYNWQAENFVFGLEGTISGLDNHGTVLNNAFGTGRDDQFGWRADWLATITGRAGVAVRNNLFYVKGGYAGANNRLSVIDVLPPVTGSGSRPNGTMVGPLAPVGNPELPRTGSSDLNMTTPPSTPSAISSPAWPRPRCTPSIRNRATFSGRMFV